MLKFGVEVEIGIRVYEKGGMRDIKKNLNLCEGFGVWGGS